MIVYFDSSAFVKLVVDEVGSDVAADLWDGCDAAISSTLAYPEVRAALAAAGRAARLTAAEQLRAEGEWEQLWAAVRTVDLRVSIAADAGRLAATHGLRGADAVHLASAIAIGVDDSLFAVWDHRLRAGADAAGVRIVPSV